EPPSADPDFILALPDGREERIRPDRLRTLPFTAVPNCFVVSTGHGTSGPFTFGGVTLLEFIYALAGREAAWSQVEVISADGFGTGILAGELAHPDPAGPILLSYTLDGRPMTRQEGLVRLIVPNEKDDALRQVKWVGRINLKP
ncbi:MAG: molybdopterin-dependent oxidoreductase, partial [Chloroflexi bacterium]|nr:molybdopterin-dependent oxidoreductase [Chloroflexota bacterium]